MNKYYVDEPEHVSCFDKKVVSLQLVHCKWICGSFLTQSVMHACLIHSKVTSFLLNGTISFGPSLMNVCALPETATDRRWAQDVTIKLKFFFFCCFSRAMLCHVSLESAVFQSWHHSAIFHLTSQYKFLAYESCWKVKVKTVKIKSVATQ